MPSRTMIRWFLLALWPAVSWAGALTWERDQIEATAGPDTPEVAADFPFRNQGDRPVTITEVKTSCGCTTALLANRVYPPGASGKIHVVFTVGDRTGTQEKFVTVTTDAPGEDEPQELELRIAIHAYFSFEPKAVFWKLGEAPVEKTIRCLALMGPDVGLVAAQPGSAAITTRIEVVEPGRVVLLHLKPVTTGTAAETPVHLRFQVGATKERAFDVFAYVVAPGGIGG